MTETLRRDVSRWQSVAAAPKRVRSHIAYHRGWSQSRSTSSRKIWRQGGGTRTHIMDGANAVWLLRHAVKNSKKMLVPQDNVTLAYKFLLMSKSRGIRWLQLRNGKNSKYVHKSQKSAPEGHFKTRGQGNVCSSNNTEYFLSGAQLP